MDWHIVICYMLRLWLWRPFLKAEALCNRLLCLKLAQALGVYHNQPGRLSGETQHPTLGALSLSPYTLCEPAIRRPAAWLACISPVRIPQGSAALTGQGKLDCDETESWAFNQLPHLSQVTRSTAPNKLY